MTMNLDTNLTLTATVDTPANNDHNEDSEQLCTCAYCGESFPESELDTIGDCTDKLYCEACRDELTTCACCGRVVHPDETFAVRGRYDEEYVCEDCQDNHYTQCAECGQYVLNANTTYHDGYDYCFDCFDENFSCCDSCGEHVRIDDINFDEVENESLCSACYNERQDERTCVIHPYHSSSRPDLEYYRTTSDLPNPLYFGVELEIDDGGEDHDKASTILKALGTEHAFAEHDGSLSDGFEIVTQPFTYKYYSETLSQNFSKTMATAAKLGYRSHDTTTCGLHVHVGRNGLGGTPEERDDTTTKIWLLLYRFRHELVAFSRRTLGNLDRWAALPKLLDLGETDFFEVRSSNLPDLNLKLKQNGVRDRYKALNLRNANTIEFRLFRGTLKHSTLTATLQFVHNLCAVAMALTGNDVLSITWEQLHTLLCLDAPELREYMKARGISPKVKMADDDDDAE